MLSVVLAGCLSVLLEAQQPKRKAEPAAEPAPPAPTVADRVTLRDGRILLGLITSPAAGPKVGFDMLVRRAWAEAHVPDLAERWLRNAATRLKPVVAERRKRLQAWREERLRHRGGDDRIATWIADELRRMDDPSALDPPLLAVRIGRDGCRSAERNADAARRMLALAWLNGMKDAEDRPPGEVQDAMEARGYAAEGGDFPSLDRLAPLDSEAPARWLARRAATELAVDSGRRFIRYESLLLPDPTDGKALDATLDLSSALGQIGRLLDPAAGAADPLGPALAKIAADGGAGAVVTRLETAPDLSRVGVEISLWIRGSGGWVRYGSRDAVVRPQDVAPDAAAAIAGDPQVESVFNIAEALGLGAVTAEMKDRSLRMGAATSRALGTARSAFLQELNALAFPVLEPTPAKPSPVDAGGASAGTPRP